jgi:hypothetical protein
MSMQTDVKSAPCAAGATTAVTDFRSRLKALTISHTTSGTVSVTDGAGGTVLFDFTAPAAVGSIHIIIPGEGILARTGLSVICAASTTAVAYYG